MLDIWTCLTLSKSEIHQWSEEVQWYEWENVCGTEGRRRVFATVAQSQRPTAVSDIRLSSRSPRSVECMCVLLHHMPWIAEVCVWSPVCGRSKIHSCQRAEEITLIHTHTRGTFWRGRGGHILRDRSEGTGQMGVCVDERKIDRECVVLRKRRGFVLKCFWCSVWFDELLCNV